MGLAAFNRMRRSRLPVEELETERFMADNKARWDAHNARAKTNAQDEKTLEKISKAEDAAMRDVGLKVEEGIKMGEEGGIPDLPLRKDHAAEIAGRTEQTPHTETLTPMERLHERIPTDETANERLVEAIGGENSPGATAALVEEVRQESLTPEEKAEGDADGTLKKAMSDAEKADADRAEAAKKGQAEADVALGEAAKVSEAQQSVNGGDPSPAQKAAEATSVKAKVEAKLPAAGPAPKQGDGEKSSSAATAKK